MKNKWIAHERIKDGNKMNLFCFAYPGGSASYFAPWKKKINDQINVIPILYPEREVRKNDPMQESFELFVNEFIEDNKELLLEPYAFFGYCGGAVLAYEIAVKVKELYGKEPVWGLIASSESPEYLKDSLVGASDGGDDQDLIKQLLKLDMFDETILSNQMFLQYYIPMLKADCKMLDTYVYQVHEKMHFDLDVLYGKDDKGMVPAKTEKWSEITAGETRVEAWDGGHYFVDPQRDRICEMINNRLMEKKNG